MRGERSAGITVISSICFGALPASLHKARIFQKTLPDAATFPGFGIFARPVSAVSYTGFTWIANAIYYIHHIKDIFILNKGASMPAGGRRSQKVPPLFLGKPAGLLVTLSGLLGTAKNLRLPRRRISLIPRDTLLVFPGVGPAGFFLPRKPGWPTGNYPGLGFWPLVYLPSFFKTRNFWVPVKDLGGIRALWLPQGTSFPRILFLIFCGPRRIYWCPL